MKRSRDGSVCRSGRTVSLLRYETVNTAVCDPKYLVTRVVGSAIGIEDQSLKETSRACSHLFYVQRVRSLYAFRFGS